MESEKIKFPLLPLATIAIIIGTIIFRVNEVAPGALLPVWQGELNMDMGLAGGAVSTIYLVCALFCIVGGSLDKKIGLKNFYGLILLLTGAGALCSFVSTSTYIFLAGRILFAIGLGLSLPFFAAAVMKWYSLRGQEYMNSANALFPYAGMTIGYFFLVPIFESTGSWRFALGIWGVGIIAVLLVWMILFKEPAEYLAMNKMAGETIEKGVYADVIKRKEVLLLCVAFGGNFISFIVVAVFLPAFLGTIGDTTLALAAQLAIIFPATGAIACFVGGWLMSVTGRRKPLLILGNIATGVGVIMAAVFVGTTLGLIGVALAGFAAAVWMPAMYQVIMELDNMTPTKAGVATGVISAVGFVCGFIAPILAGGAVESMGFVNVFIIAAIPAIIGGLVCLAIRETGPAANR